MVKSCIIIEDQPPAQRILQRYIADTDSLELKATFSDAVKAIQYLKTATVDLIFLDIHLPKISGVEFLKSVPNHPSVILTTAFSDYALESYEYNVVDYLLKPFSFPRFIQAISKLPVIDHEISLVTPLISDSSKNNEAIFIKSGHEYIKVLISDIIYIKSDIDYTEIVTFNKKYLSVNSLKYWEDTLDKNVFTRIHKSYIISISHIVKVAGNLVHFSQGTVPIGRMYKESFIHTYMK